MRRDPRRSLGEKFPEVQVQIPRKMGHVGGVGGRHSPGTHTEHAVGFV